MPGPLIGLTREANWIIPALVRIYRSRGYIYIDRLYVYLYLFSRLRPKQRAAGQEACVGSGSAYVGALVVRLLGALGLVLRLGGAWLRPCRRAARDSDALC